MTVRYVYELNEEDLIALAAEGPDDGRQTQRQNGKP